MIKNKAQPEATPVSQDATRVYIPLEQVIVGDQSLRANEDSSPAEAAETLGSILRTPD